MKTEIITNTAKGICVKIINLDKIEISNGLAYVVSQNGKILRIYFLNDIISICEKTLVPTFSLSSRYTINGKTLIDRGAKNE